ncbi:hypothetical protein WG907_03250 [Sphingobium sp. AN558]|uniref:hypothetical protein n=1 Tax=Sphingobium sp. AN558 TaxID=3133442 RepID=UPI0030BA34FE
MANQKPALRTGPRAVICAGIFSSGSTWIFNAVQEILRHAAPGMPVTPIYMDSLDDANGSDLWQSSRAVIKTHAPGAFLRRFAATEAVPVILSVRDPRDAVSSLMQRFFLSFDQASDFVLRASHGLPLLIEGVVPDDILVLRYEDGFTRRRSTLADIAEHIGVMLPKAAIAPIAAALAPGAVKAEIAALHDQGVFDDRPPLTQFDPNTHWHPRHLGDGKSGKWQSAMTEAQAGALIERSGFLRPIYGLEPPHPVASGKTVRFGPNGDGVQYLGEGFYYDEGYKAWAVKSRADMILPLARPIAGALSLIIACRSDVPIMPHDASPLHVRVNGMDAVLTQVGPAKVGGRITLTAQVKALPVTARLTLAFSLPPPEAGNAPVPRSDRPSATISMMSIRLASAGRPPKI